VLVIVALAVGCAAVVGLRRVHSGVQKAYKGPLFCTPWPELNLRAESAQESGFELSDRCPASYEWLPGHCCALRTSGRIFGDSTLYLLAEACLYAGSHDT
jgi:hypothetical protein